MILRTVRRASLVAFLVAAINFVVLTLLGSYNFHVGPVHLFATYLFKPLLYLNAAFLIAFALKAWAQNEDVGEALGNFNAGARFWVVAAAIVLAVYGISFTINLNFFDWTHRASTTGHSPFYFFTHRQYDGFYRPLGFCSLWLDNRIFGGALWGYHFQNLAVHILNGWLAARLAFRLGVRADIARWTGLAFIALPYSFEAVIWPGARFDLLAASFTLLAVERALAGSVWTSTIAYCLAALSKETAYAYPLLLAVLWLLRNPLRLNLLSKQWGRTFAATAVATLLMLAMRVAVYGNLGGYPNTQHGGTVNFVLQTKTFTSMFTRLPAVLFLFNTGAGLPVWLRIALLGYVIVLGIVLFSRVSPGAFALLMVLAIVAVLPMMNMFGWMTQFAQQGRYLYHPAIWVVIPISVAIGQLPRKRLVFTGWIAVMCVAALFSELVYVRMRPAVQTTVAEAAAACQTASCCRAVSLQAVPRDWRGAFYFHAQVRHDLAERLPGISVNPANSDACTVYPQFDPAIF